MTVLKRSKRFFLAKNGAYEIKVKDYGYISRAPVSVTVSGTVLGESVNPFGEPCYFLKFDEAMNLDAGIQIAMAIVASRQAKVV